MPGCWPPAGCTPSCTTASSAPSTHPTPPDLSPSPPRVSPCCSQRRRPPDDRSLQRPAHPKGKRALAGARENRYEDRRPQGDDEAVREGGFRSPAGQLTAPPDLPRPRARGMELAGGRELPGLVLRTFRTSVTAGSSGLLVTRTSAARRM